MPTLALVQGWSRRTVHTDCPVDSVKADKQGTLILQRHHQPKPADCRVPNIKKPPGISRIDGKRPDGLTLIPWQGGRCLLLGCYSDGHCGSLLPAPNVLRGRCSGRTCSQQKDREV